jgi:O-antigen/teichoic acid export membrane protein
MKAKMIGAVYNKTLAYSVIVTTPIIAYIGVFSAPLVYLFISHSFGSAPLYLTLMAFGTMIGLAGIYAMNLFVARGRTSKLLTYGVLYFLAQLIALVVLVPFFGVIGAIVALFFVDGIVCSYIFLRGIRTSLGIRTDYDRLLRAFGSNLLLIAAFALGLLSSSFVVELIYGLVALLVAYPFFLVILRAVKKEDVQIMREAVEKLPSIRPMLDPLLSYFGFLVGHLR